MELLFRRHHFPGLRKAQASLKGKNRNASWQPPTAMSVFHAALLRYCRRQIILLTTHASLARPARQPFLKNYGTLGSAYLHLSIHDLSCLQCGSLQSCLCSIFWNSRCTGNIDRTIGKVFAHCIVQPWAAVTPRLVRPFDESSALCMPDVTVCAVRIW